MKLIIAEKPSLAKTIAAALHCTTRDNGYFSGKEFIVTFAYGHLFTLKSVDGYLGEKKKWQEVPLPFFPIPYEFILKDDEGVRKQFDVIKNLILQPETTEIINCGDADREGQIIVDKIIEAAFSASGHQKPVKRLWLPEQTAEVITAEVQALKSNDDYKNLYNEGLARTIFDWAIGINYSRIVSIKARQMLPCGRVLIPIIKIIHDRDIAIRNFKPEKYLQLENTDNIPISLKKKYLVSERAAADQAAAALNATETIVDSIAKKEVIKKPTKLFSLSTLQSKLSQDFKMDFGTSLEIIQSLYEKGLLTYPRTNTEYIGESEKDRIKGIINTFSTPDMPLEFKDTKRIFDSSKVESHSAITITSKKATSDITAEEKIVYETVYNRFVSNFLSEDCIVLQVKATISIGEHQVILTGETVKQLGWMKFEPKKLPSELPELKEGQHINVAFKVIEKQTSKPAKITESSLSRYLKNPFNKHFDEEETEDSADEENYNAMLKGIEIGTEATRTGIIENAIKYEYISRKGQSFSIQLKGENLIATLEQLNINLAPEQTVKFSVLQKKIYKGEETVENAIQQIHAEIAQTIEGCSGIDIQIAKQEKPVVGNCPRCNKPVYESNKGFYCQGFTIRSNPEAPPECDFFLQKKHKFFTDKGKSITLSLAKKFLSDGRANVKGLKPKDPTKKAYDALVIMDDTGTWINFKLQF